MKVLKKKLDWITFEDAMWLGSVIAAALVVYFFGE